MGYTGCVPPQLRQDGFLLSAAPQTEHTACNLQYDTMWPRLPILTLLWC